jgi:FecR-like protein
MNKTRLTTIAVLPLILGAFSFVAVGQNRERLSISAKAGGVNTVLGHVMIARQGQDPQLLSATDDVAAKDIVTTGTTSNAEILLNPGSYLRLAENSEFQFDDISLDHLKLRLTKGSAIVEATGIADMDLGINLTTPHATFTIIRSGIYRISVEPDSASLAVYKGRASYGPNNTDVLKGGNSVRLSNGVAELAKVPKEKDAFELWSKQRAQLLAKANERLSGRALNGYLSNRGWDSWLWGPSRFGLWTFNSSFGCYTFLPFFYGWSSPYGHYYGSYFWRGGGYYGHNPNPIIVNNQTPTVTNSGTTTPGGSSGIIPGVGGINGTPSSGGVTRGNGAPRDPDSGGRSISRTPRDPQP